MTAFVQVKIETSPFERIETELAVAGFFLDERPLRGAAGRADWRLCGIVSDLVSEGRLHGRVGETVLAPSLGRLAAERILLQGLGRRSSFRAARARTVGAAAISCGIGLGATRVALAAPLLGNGQLADYANALLEGALGAVRANDSELVLSLVVPPENEAVARRSAQAVIAAEPDPGLRLQLVKRVSRGRSRATR